MINARTIKDETYIEETIKGLIDSEGHLDKNGCRDYDKVPYGVCEDAIILLTHYKEVLDCMKEIRKEMRIKKMFNDLTPI